MLRRHLVRRHLHEPVDGVPHALRQGGVPLARTGDHVAEDERLGERPAQALADLLAELRQGVVRLPKVRVEGTLRWPALALDRALSGAGEGGPWMQQGGHLIRVKEAAGAELADDTRGVLSTEEGHTIQPVPLGTGGVEALDPKGGQVAQQGGYAPLVLVRVPRGLEGVHEPVAVRRRVEDRPVPGGPGEPPGVS